MGKYLIALISLPYSAIRAFTTSSEAAALSVILITKLSEDPFTVADTTPVLDRPFLSITTVVLPPDTVPVVVLPGLLLELEFVELPLPVEVLVLLPEPDFAV